MAKITGEFWAIPKEIMAMNSLSLESRMIYAVLFTRSNGENVSWPSQKSLAQTIGCGIRSVQRHINELKELGLIEVSQSGKKRTNRYTLTRQIVASLHDTAVVSQGDRAVVSSVKEQKKKNIPNGSAPRAEWESLIPLWESLNPAFKGFYSNKTERNAMAWLAEEYGMDGLRRKLEFLPRIIGQPFAPRITTPYQLKIKMGDLQAFLAQQKQKNSKNQVVVIP